MDNDTVIFFYKCEVDRLTWQVEQRVHDVDALFLERLELVRVHLQQVIAAFSTRQTHNGNW